MGTYLSSRCLAVGRYVTILQRLSCSGAVTICHSPDVNLFLFITLLLKTTALSSSGRSQLFALFLHTTYVSQHFHVLTKRHCLSSSRDNTSIPVTFLEWSVRDEERYVPGSYETREGSLKFLFPLMLGLELLSHAFCMLYSHHPL
jgi:hypothetical protein